MDMKFERGTRYADVVHALEQAGCVMFDDDTWQPENPNLDGCFEKSGLCISLDMPDSFDRNWGYSHYFPEDEEPPTAWLVGDGKLGFYYLECTPQMKQDILAFMMALQKLSSARFALQWDDEVRAQRTAQGLVLEPAWHEFLGPQAGVGEG